jgi:hypothetical protein
MSLGSLKDPVDDKTIWWYKVLGVDKNGNESKIDDAVPISSFTFTTQQPASPSISSISIQSPTCALVVEWSPSYDSIQHQGFVVFKSKSSSGPFMQVGDIIQGNTYTDPYVVRGVDYWYRVLQIDNRGKLSKPSSSSSGKVNTN